MYIARFSYDVAPVNRQRALDFIRREVEAARRDSLNARLLVPLTRGQSGAALQFEVEPSLDRSTRCGAKGWDRARKPAAGCTPSAKSHGPASRRDPAGDRTAGGVSLVGQSYRPLSLVSKAGCYVVICGHRVSRPGAEALIMLRSGRCRSAVRTWEAARWPDLLDWTFHKS